MKNKINLLCLAAAFSVNALWPIATQAATFELLHSFAPFSFKTTNSAGDPTNSDGLNPFSSLVVSGNLVYGTAQGGGPEGFGTVFSMDTSGAGFTTLHSFSLDTNNGAGPNAGLLLAGNVLYGTTASGGNYDAGAVFAVNADGTGYTNLYNFTGLIPDGADPISPLVLSGDTLYGTAYFGGNPGSGSVFAVSTNGTGFRTVYNFSGASDGGSPSAGLIISGNTLFGTASYGAGANFGTIFAVNTDGSGFTLLHTFSLDTNTDSEGLSTNSDGAVPLDSLVLVGDTLYGTASQGGLNGWGTVFSVKTNGADFSVLHTFSKITVSIKGPKNSDGATPLGGLIASGSTLYGTASYGGAGASGTVFSLHTDGSDFTTLTSFPTFPADGDDPVASLALSGTTLYGTTRLGGTNQTGNIFGIALGALPVSVPQITLDPISQTNDSGTTVTFLVNATATGKISYQWLLNGKKIPGAILQTLTLKNLTTANAGNYTVAVSDSGGSVTSTPATLTVLEVPSITTQPVPQAEALGGIATFSIKATGAPSGYMWIFDNAPLSDNSVISGSATNLLTINLLSATNFGTYAAVVSNSNGSVTSKVVQLTFSAEKTKPSVTITSPKPASRSANLTLSGTALDKVRVQSVNYWITNFNNSVLTMQNGQAVLSVGAGKITSSNWTVQVTLLPGTNILAVQSVNYAGLDSPVEKATFFYKVITPFQLVISPQGEGTVTGVASVKGDALPVNGAELNVGESYTLTGKPVSNWLLTNWMENASLAGTKTTLTFIMESNLVITANFVTNSVVKLAARYDGLFSPSDPNQVTIATSGLIENLQLENDGVYSGKLFLAGTNYPLVGTFNTSGQATETIARDAAVGGNVTVRLNISGQSSLPQITGSVQGSNLGGWISTNLCLYAATTDTNDFPASIVPLTLDSNTAGGVSTSAGYANVSATGGVANMTFHLSDGSTFNSSAAINEQNQIPVYGSLDNGSGLVLGQLSLGNAQQGNLTWITPTQTIALHPK